MNRKRIGVVGAALLTAAGTLTVSPAVMSSVAAPPANCDRPVGERVGGWVCIGAEATTTTK